MPRTTPTTHTTPTAPAPTTPAPTTHTAPTSPTTPTPTAPAPAPNPPSEVTITCPHYQRVPLSKRCRHYGQGGLCQRPEAAGGKCLEWLKVNAPPQAAPEPASRDLFGAPVAPPPPRRPPHTAPPAPSGAPANRPPVVRNVTDAEVASFKALGVEVCIRSDALGPVWLVPEYTDTGRTELSVEHSVLLTAICAAFPGAKVVAMNRRSA